MREPFIFLCSEITADHAQYLVNWLQDEQVKRYLNEVDDISGKIAMATKSAGLAVLTHLFAQGCRFYMICRGDHKPVGFARLDTHNDETELVIVIGDKSHWGRRFGYSAIRECMRVAFFELRSKKIIANIHKENERSIRAFLNARFHMESETRTCRRYAITLNEYLRLSNEGIFTPDVILVTQTDCLRLKELVGRHGDVERDKLADELHQEITRAKIVGPEQIGRDVVTMRSRTVLMVNGQEHELSLVYPEEADINTGKLSVLSPIGTAILGYSKGDAILWQVPAGQADIRIGEILYQPESAGDYHL